MHRDPLAATLLAEAPLAFVDVETTGLSAWAGDRVCELGIVRCQGREEVGRMDTLINPERPISAGARAVNGISEARVARAPGFAAVAREVVAALEGAVIVAHNAPFDLSFLVRELSLVGLPTPGGITFDTLTLARRAYPGSSNGLAAVAHRLGVRTPGHRALADVLTTREVFWRLVEPIVEAGGTVADVLAAQAMPAPTRRPRPTPGGAGSDRTAAAGSQPALLAAIRSRARLRVSYRSAGGQLTDRVIDPLALLDQGHDMLVIAYCHLRREERTFYLGRILGWSLAGNSQEPDRPAAGNKPR